MEETEIDKLVDAIDRKIRPYGELFILTKERDNIDCNFKLGIMNSAGIPIKVLEYEADTLEEALSSYYKRLLSESEF